MPAMAFPARSSPTTGPRTPRFCRLTDRADGIGVAVAGARLSHNCVQVVGSTEGAVKPHTDSSNLCRYAAVLYLNPDVPDHSGTSFFRQRMTGGALGGNIVPSPHHNLVEAPGNRFVPPNAFVVDVSSAHRFNRLLLYKANLIHSASAYWGP